MIRAMNKNRPLSITIGVIALLLVLALAWFFSPSQKIAREDAGVRQLVLDFGSKLQQVSLAADRDRVRTAIEERYAPYVTPELLAAWMANPDRAPGRETSSPWPDRVNVATITQQGRSRIVNGEIIYMTSAEAAGESADTVPYVAQVTQIDGQWKIAAFDEQHIPTEEVTSDEDPE